MTKRIEDLVQSLCGAADHPLAPVLRGWCAASRPFAAFAETHATKIRKKVRLAAHGDERDDLLAELAVAAFLLRDRRFSVRYEPQRATGQRGPDFGVTFRTHTLFHVEVTRLRLSDPAGEDRAGTALRLARAVGDKLGQCPAGGANLLAVVVPPGAEDGALVPAAVRLLEAPSQRETNPPSPGLRPEDVRAYLRGRSRLSAVALCSLTEAGPPLTVRLWNNPQARHPLPPEVARFLVQTAS